MKQNIIGSTLNKRLTELRLLPDIHVSRLDEAVADSVLSGKVSEHVDLIEKAVGRNVMFNPDALYSAVIRDKMDGTVTVDFCT